MLGMPGPRFMQINKTDRNDGFGLAQIVRTGWYREVGVKASRTTRCVRYWEPALKLVGMGTDIRNQIRGLLKIFGVVLERHSDKSFEERVKEAARRNKGIWHDTPQLARC